MTDLKDWTEVPIKPAPTYANFNVTTGYIDSFSDSPLGEHSIEVEYDSVRDIIEGKAFYKHYKVLFNPASTMYELVNVHEEKAYEYNVNNSFYKVQENDSADIILVKNYITQQWELTFGKLFQKTLDKNNVTLQTKKQFSIVKKNDPYVLYRELNFDLSSNDLVLQFNENDSIIEFDVYTTKVFNSYGVQVVKN